MPTSTPQERNSDTVPLDWSEFFSTGTIKAIDAMTARLG
jgi:hypothetical protein